MICINKHIKLVIKILSLTVVFLVFLAVIFVWFGLATKVKATTQVTICHNSGQSGSYQKITVDWNAVDGQGGGDHNSSNHQNGRDIIPPGFWDSNGRNWDMEGQAIWNNSCNVPQPTPTVVPTATPTATPTPTQTPKEECGEGYVEVEEECVPVPTPTREPEPTPWPGFSDPEPGSAPVCTDLSTILLPLNFHVIRNGAVATLKWVPTQGDQVNVFYKENGQPGWTHALGDQTNDGYLEIGGLNPSLGYTFGLMQKNGCGGGQTASAVVVDPPAYGQIFRFSYWVWN